LHFQLNNDFLCRLFDQIKTERFSVSFGGIQPGLTRPDGGSITTNVVVIMPDDFFLSTAKVNFS
jgi:hypothetical protein